MLLGRCVACASIALLRAITNLLLHIPRRTAQRSGCILGHACIAHHVQSTSLCILLVCGRSYNTWVSLLSAIMSHCITSCRLSSLVVNDIELSNQLIYETGRPSSIISLHYTSDLALLLSSHFSSWSWPWSWPCPQSRFCLWHWIFVAFFLMLIRMTSFSAATATEVARRSLRLSSLLCLSYLVIVGH